MENAVTIRSTRSARMYEPGAWVSRVSPTPLLMVIASRDATRLRTSPSQLMGGRSNPRSSFWSQADTSTAQPPAKVCRRRVASRRRLDRNSGGDRVQLRGDDGAGLVGCFYGRGGAALGRAEL
jgi:hypothetical protein